MNALHLIIFANKRVAPFIYEIQHDFKATGIANMVGNKGGVAITISISNKSYLFVSCHLASG